MFKLTDESKLRYSLYGLRKGFIIKDYEKYHKKELQENFFIIGYMFLCYSFVFLSGIWFTLLLFLQ